MCYIKYKDKLEDIVIEEDIVDSIITQYIRSARPLCETCKVGVFNNSTLKSFIIDDGTTSLNHI